MVRRLERHLGLLAREHAEQRVAVMRSVEFPERLKALSRLIEDADVHHLVDAVMSHVAVLRVVHHEVVLLVVPHQSPWAALVPHAVVPRLHLLLQVPVEVLELYLPVLVDRLVQLVDVVINTLVHRLDAPGHDDLAVELLRLVDADQRFKFLDQLARLAVGDELRGLHRVHEQLQFRQLKVTYADAVVDVVPRLVRYDVQAEVAELFEVAVKRLPVGIDSVSLELVDDLGHSKAVRVIRLLQEYLREIEHLQFLVVTLACHYHTSLILTYIFWRP